ncbi:GAF domain-containing hybrid sensor histidine kinase/response regulator [Halioxenophilus aromaticivorans]|uniref:histidine kinase n=1 Tax=Halioxenophilus aromaticivorans TaxID=1306992 RepID=A0AAV3U0D0_9ALTE
MSHKAEQTSATANAQGASAEREPAPGIHEATTVLARMRAYNAELDRLMRMQFYSDTTLDQLLLEATRTVSQALGVRRVSVWSYNANRDGILCDCLYEGTSFNRQSGVVLHMSDCPRYFEAISQNRVITVQDARSDKRTSEFTEAYLKPLNIFSLLDAHVPSAAGVRGVLCCENVHQIRQWTLEESSFVASVAELIGLAFDRAERLKTQEQLADALRAAERAGEAKSTFLATMSHEIRTPLNGVLGMLELVLHDEPNPERRQNLEIAHKSAHSLLDVLGDVLDYSRLEAGEFQVQSEPYSLVALVQEIASLYQTQAEAKGLSIKVAIDYATPKSVLGDEARVRQILTNFFSNAVKFTHQGHINVTLFPEQHAGLPYLRLEVSDTGIGIPDVALKTLFKRFSQVDSSTTRQYGGSGLGLAICKQMVELMGGEIGVTSSANKGSTFWVRLPRVAANQPENQNAQMGAVDWNSKPKHKLNILAAEDNIINQKVLKAMVKSLGHTMTIANNGLEAIEALAQQHYDAVLMDVQMPVMDGLTATQAIRELPEPNNHITIIALTANAMAGDKDQYLAAGMNDYLAKPLERAQLAQALARVKPQNKSRLDQKGQSD